ncbi:COG3014 family protein [Parasediminibacterium sp. JCM 36343]|uniref:COG3014 family protein n=1 Tax=Parasediminibacterium sp. JCM 36343 TaxID=3374279 RepID=UPI0039790CBE
MNIYIIVKRALVVCLLMPVLFSCSTYNTKLAAYYGQVRGGNYAKALHELDNSRFMNQKRNDLLYYFEKGKLFHLTHQYDSSNLYFNLADKFIDEAHKTVGDVAVGNLINPMVQAYRGEDFESFLIHYYKALNYYYLGKIDDAVVEARRISLTNNAQTDKFSNKATRYSKDAFMLNMQGILYELSGDINNAFISYRNAVDAYTASGGTYYGVDMPLQLKKDVIKTSLSLGFTDEAARYKQQFNLANNDIADTASGSLVVFIEQGWAPEKREQDFFLANNGNGISNFYYLDEGGNTVQVPFDVSYYKTIHPQDVSASDFRTFRVAMPYYSPITLSSPKATVVVNGTTYPTEMAENINSLAVNILKERRFKEIADAIARQIVKKLAEKGVEAGAREIAKNNSNEKDQTKKNQDAETAGAVAGLLVNLLNTATEKADTRNWQSLPAFITYTRIPLQKGQNNITLSSGGLQKTITINSNGGLQLYNWCVGR